MRNLGEYGFDCFKKLKEEFCFDEQITLEYKKLKPRHFQKTVSNLYFN